MLKTVSKRESSCWRHAFIWLLLGPRLPFAQDTDIRRSLYFSVDSRAERSLLSRGQLSLYEDRTKCEISRLEPEDCGLSMQVGPGITAVLLDASNMLAGNPGAESSSSSKALRRLARQTQIAVYTLSRMDFKVYGDFEFLSGTEYRYSVRRDRAIDTASRVFRKAPPTNPHRRTVIPLQDIYLRNLSVIESIANHFSATPGHKSLVWYCSENSILKRAPPIGSELRDAWFAALAAVEKANLSIYPIKCLYDVPDLHAPNDARALTSKNSQPEVPVNPQNRDPEWAENAVRSLAELTGGKYFLGDDQLEKGVFSAIADNRQACSISWKGPVRSVDASRSRQLLVNVNNQQVTLRYPGLHVRRSDLPESEAARISDMERCLATPLSQRGLLIEASIRPASAGNRNYFDLFAKVSGQGYRESSSLEEADALLLFLNGDGLRMKKGISTAIRLHAQNGIAEVSLRFEAPPDAQTLRLGFRERVSHDVGTVEVPLR